MEGSPTPMSRDNIRRRVVIEVVNKIFSPDNKSVKVKFFKLWQKYLLAFLCIIHRVVIAVEEFPIKKLDSHHRKD